MRALFAIVAVVAGCATSTHLEQRNDVTLLRGPYNAAFFWRHNDSFRYSAAFHYHHGKQHDVLDLTPLADHLRVDQAFDADVTSFVYEKKAYTEPTMELFGPYVARVAWRLYRAIDWTHMHHEQTYDILSARGIPWSEKKTWTDRAVAYYLHANPVARSCAPLDVTMRRAGVMMKPYFGYYRNYYPRSSEFAYVAHWWHPAAYEAMMIGGNGPGQDAALDAVDRLMLDTIFADRPQRMLLSREIMPRYSRLSPESANIFDNLHELHGLAYDILAYDKWTNDEKRAELYRVIDAMAYRPGDEQLARKFAEPHPDADPRVYAPWMKPSEGEMSRIMSEMLDEMMPMMMPQGMSDELKTKVHDQVRMKMAPGMEPGEFSGSLHDALLQLMPDMKMDPEGMKPGKTPTMMVDAMLDGWRSKYGDMPDIPPWPMDQEPGVVTTAAATPSPTEALP